MKTETKVEMMRYILLQESRLYDNILFTLLSTRSLMNEVERSDERTFSFDIEPESKNIKKLGKKDYEVKTVKLGRCVSRHISKQKD